MRIKQYSYFVIRSASVSTDEIAARVGLEADRRVVRGSRTRDPDRPAQRAWEVSCDEPGLTVDQQVDRVVARLVPHRPAIKRLLREVGDAEAALQVVRYFDAFLAADEGEDEAPQTRTDGLEKLPGQHQLLGWHLRREVIEFLPDTEAEMDVDEYG